jgi:hypothetical protein
MAAGLFAVFLALVWLCGDCQMPHDAYDPVQVIWRRYEQGDLTRERVSGCGQRGRDSSLSLHSPPGGGRGRRRSQPQLALS